VTQLVDSSIGIIDGASWGEDDSIVIGSVARGLRRIQVGGSVVEVLATPIAEEGETAYVWPQSADGGRAVIYTALGPSFVARDAKIVILDVASGARTVIAERGTYGRYLPSGHVVYVDSTGALMAVPFDIEQREVSPVVAVPVETGVRIAFWAGAASFGVSATGTLAFARGSNWENQLLEVVDRTGTTIRRVGVPLSTDTVTLSRDGRTVAVDQFGPDNADIYTYNVETGSRNRVTRDDAMEENGVISPDGSRIAYMRSSAGNVGQILVQSVEGNSQPKPVYEGTQYELPQSWSTDGKYLVISSSDAGGQGDILAIDVDDPDAAPIEIATTERDERPGDFSSDGRYFAFVADDDIVIRPFPALDADFVITDAISPRWTDDELFFVRGSTLMALPIATDPGYRSLGEPHSLFDLPILLSSLSADRTSALFSPFRDGQTFLIDVPNRDAAYIANEIWVVLNWFEALKARVPVP